MFRAMSKPAASGMPSVVLLAPMEQMDQLKAAIDHLGLEVRIANSPSEARRHEQIGAIVMACSAPEDALAELRKDSRFKQLFKIVLNSAIAEDVCKRLVCFDAGANMVTSSLEAAATALSQVAEVLRSPGPYACPTCGLSLNENALHLHMHLQHATDDNPRGPCPICKKSFGNLAVHLTNAHGPPENREPPAAPFACFAWCVCRRSADGRFLLVNEPAGISGGRPGYWLPAGRVDSGESLVDACRREALEEAGVAVRVTGVLRFMVDCRGTLRVVFLAEPEDPKSEPKSIPDWESVGAVWAHVHDLARLKERDYRSPDPAKLYPKVSSGELHPHSLDTPAFASLEALIIRLTAGERAESELATVWADIKATYPPSAFVLDR